MPAHLAKRFARSALQENSLALLAQHRGARNAPRRVFRSLVLLNAHISALLAVESRAPVLVPCAPPARLKVRKGKVHAICARLGALKFHQDHHRVARALRGAIKVQQVQVTARAVRLVLPLQTSALSSLRIVWLAAQAGSQLSQGREGACNAALAHISPT